jgi:hypothetical protein
VAAVGDVVDVVDVMLAYAAVREAFGAWAEVSSSPC